jgi:energy-coupling factor transporter ATP-binding protein EcfA2
MHLEKNSPTILVLGNYCSGKTRLLNSLTGQIFPTSNNHSPAMNVLPFKSGEHRANLIELSVVPEAIFSRNIQVVAVLFLIDVYAPMQSSHSLMRSAMQQLETIGLSVPHPPSVVLTKIDGISSDNIQAIKKQCGFDQVLCTSALNGIGIDGLRAHIHSKSAWPEKDEEKRRAVIFAIGQKATDAYCAEIAKDPRTLRYIEWRELEKIIAASLETIGFTVELTPGSKDGGKDIVATCRVKDKKHVFYVEIKHWHSARPGTRHVSAFVEVNVRDGTDGGLFLSSSGYTQSVYARRTVITRDRVVLGQQEKIVSLCQHYVLARQACWVPEESLPHVLFGDALGDDAREVMSKTIA